MLCTALPAHAAATGAFLFQGKAYSSVACANEGGACRLNLPTTVAYGAQGRFAVRTFTAGTAPCSNATFGDPMSGVVKACYVATSATAASTATAQTPAPSQIGGTTPAISAQQWQASRLLSQATYGATFGEITAAATMTPAAWVDNQLRRPLTVPSHWDYVARGGPLGTSGYINAAMESFWSQAATGQDQLRQRTVLALSEIFVVSTINSAVEIQAGAHASYLDTLARNAFGNYRQLLEDVALHPTMGLYLSHLKNDKEDPVSGRIPDENFAREVMQLFSIGLWQLNPDGSRRLDTTGQPIPTYGQDEVMGMAKVFTGWGWGGKGTSEGDWNGWTGNAGSWDKKLINYPTHHSSSEKRIVGGVVIPAGTGGPQSLKIALDTLANHPNVGPFLGRQMIQRFVTSNPSPAYVARVSTVWANNGAGVRGDLGAVMKAILTDPEARNDASLADPQFGKLREPLVRFGQWIHAFNARPANGVWQIWNLENSVSSIGQNPLRAPSVFNWFRPTYAPPGPVAQAGKVAPEFQITHETTITGYTNFMSLTAEHGAFGITPDYSAFEALADRPDALLDRLSLVLTARPLAPNARLAIRRTIEAIPMTPASARTDRTVAAIYLVMSSPDYTVQR
jgi:uncharacterized protein (DUF1800 family)